MSEKCHVWTAPDWQGLFFTPQAWSVLPCVRPFNAAHMTAGHNALRGSGPDQTPAFDNASTQVGCPDRRIDRLCITCCSPFQPSHHAGCPARSRLPRKRDGFLVSLAPSHHGPDHSRDLVGERDSRNLGRGTTEALQRQGFPHAMVGGGGAERNVKRGRSGARLHNTAMVCRGDDVQICHTRWECAVVPPVFARHHNCGSRGGVCWFSGRGRQSECLVGEPTCQPISTITTPNHSS
jgi:hypothetical protein